jgi:hypothetical protein
MESFTEVKPRRD